MNVFAFMNAIMFYLSDYKVYAVRCAMKYEAINKTHEPVVELLQLIKDH